MNLKKSTTREEKAAYVAVTVVSRTDSSALVQYVENGVLTRKTIPTHFLRDNQVSESTLAQGIPYGFPFDEISIEFNVRKFMNELHNLDIWTVEDLLRSPRKLQSAMNAGFADNISKILELSQLEKKGVTHGN